MDTRTYKSEETRSGPSSWRVTPRVQVMSPYQKLAAWTMLRVFGTSDWIDSCGREATASVRVSLVGVQEFACLVSVRSLRQRRIAPDVGTAGTGNGVVAYSRPTLVAPRY